MVEDTKKYIESAFVNSFFLTIKFRTMKTYIFITALLRISTHLK